MFSGGRNTIRVQRLKNKRNFKEDENFYKNREETKKENKRFKNFRQDKRGEF